MTTNVQFVRKSSNAKTGKIPTTTSGRDTCPDSCPLKDAGCYASAGYYTRMNWDKVDSGDRGTDYPTFLDAIRKLPQAQLWRHNVAGDLQGNNDVIDRDALQALTEANRGKRGFTYTHYPKTHDNLEAVADACHEGFTVNLSCDTPQEAEETLSNTGLPVVSLVPSVEWWRGDHRRGNIIRCPAETRDTSCSECQLCSYSSRDTIVGFTAHGTQSKAVEIIASA